MFFMEKYPKSASAEAYRELKSNIQYSSFDKKYKTIVITSPMPAEGKSITAGNLALALSQGEKRVLLLDCDLRRPSLHKKFNVSNANGLSDLLTENMKIEDVQKEYTKNLTIITGGRVPPNPSEMLESNKMTEFLEEMKKRFDYIIIDTPPIKVVTDARILSTKADGVVLVVKSKCTKRNDIMQAVESINKVNGKIIGTVLNGKKEKAKNYNYYYTK